MIKNNDVSLTIKEREKRSIPNIRTGYLGCFLVDTIRIKYAEMIHKEIKRGSETRSWIPRNENGEKRKYSDRYLFF
jgi:hypothetical protein